MGKACVELLLAQRTLTTPSSFLLALAVLIHFVFGTILALPVSPANSFLNNSPTGLKYLKLGEQYIGRQGCQHMSAQGNGLWGAFHCKSTELY